MQSNVVLPKRGMILDSLDIETPGDMVTFALNAAMDSTDGEGVNYISEPGLKEFADLPTGYKVLGHVNLEREEQAVFLTNGTNKQIGVVKEGTYTLIDESEDLPFDEKHAITGVYRLREGCQRVIYFHDGNTFDFFYNLDRPNDFRTDGVMDVKKLRLQQEITNPCITTVLRKAGPLKMGQYRFITEMLDADFNTIGYSHVSAPVYIKKDGGSIIVEVSEIANEIRYIRFYVAQWVGSIGAPAVYQFGDEVLVVDGTASTTFEGVDAASNAASDLERFLLRPIIYDYSRDMYIVDDRLVRAGVRERFVDYSSFQRSASKIITRAKIKTYAHDEVAPTLMGDEIYSVGIVYQFEGFETPEFHIPGTAKDHNECSYLDGNNDSLILDTWTPDMEFLGIADQAALDLIGGVERWKVYNTAIAGDNDDYRPGYYECESLYSNPFDCEENYWGTDACGNVLEGTPIRHHRMPDRTLSEIYTTGSLIQALGLEFDNIEYPHDDIIGHYFVIRKRTQKTVLDKGVLAPMIDGDLGRVFCYFEAGEGDDHCVFFSPLTQKGKSLEATYFKLEKRNTQRRKLFYEELYNPAISGKDFYIGARVLFYDEYEDPAYTNLSIQDEIMLQPGESLEPLDGTDMSNLSFSNFAHVNKLSRSIEGLHYAAAKVWRTNAYADLFSGEYVRLHTCMKTIDGDQSCFDGDTFISEFRLPHITTRQVKQGIWDDILIAYLSILSLAVIVLTAGVGAVGVGAGLAAIAAAGIATGAAIGAIISTAIGVSIALIKATQKLIFEGAFEDQYLSRDDNDFTASAQLGTGFTYIACELLENFYVESDTNFNFAKKEFEFEGGNKWKGKANNREEVLDFFYGRIAYYDSEEEKHFLKPIIIPEIYEYSEDFLYQDDLHRIYIPLPVTTDFCSKCANEHPNWIIWSNNSFTDSVSDGFRTFLSENYITLGDHTGAITSLYYDGSNLWVRTMQSMFRLSPNPQFVKTDAEEAYLGTGVFLGVPAEHINPVNYGYAGGQGLHDQVATEFGWVTADVRSGRIFLVAAGKLQEIEAGASMWMRRNLPIKMLEQSRELYNIDYPFADSTIHDFGVGVILYYDPILKRVFIHKKDFKVLNSGTVTLITPGFTSPFSYQHIFQNLSFTISFGLKQGSFLSFHSAMPEWAWNNDRIQFMSEGTNKIWATDEFLCGKFFGVQYPFIVEIANVKEKYHTLDVIDFQTFTKEYDVDEEQWIDVYGLTFDGLWVYNEDMSTKEMALIFLDKKLFPHGQVGWSFDSLLVDRSSNHYRVAGFKDIAIAQPTATKAWTKIQSYFLNSGHGFIDKVVNEDALNPAPTQWELNDMYGKYHKVRFFFSNGQGHKMIVNVFNTLLRERQI